MQLINVSPVLAVHRRVIPGLIFYLQCGHDCCQIRWNIPAFVIVLVLFYGILYAILLEQWASWFLHISTRSISNFQKNRRTDFQNCRSSLIWAALESSDPRASNGGPNVEIGPNAADLITVEMSRLTRNWVWNQQKSWQKNIFFCQLGFFKRNEISSKKSNAGVWPAVGCVRIRAFQCRSNYCCTTNLWGSNALISEKETKCSNFEQNRFTKSQKGAGVRIITECYHAQPNLISLLKFLMFSSIFNCFRRLLHMFRLVWTHSEVFGCVRKGVTACGSLLAFSGNFPNLPANYITIIVKITENM